MKRKWTTEEAVEWYGKLPWLRGCNFIGSDCTNRLDMFQSHRSEEKLITADRELALAHELGFNTVRIWANFDTYLAEPDSYMEIFDRYVELCGNHGQKIMVVLAHEEDLPRGEIFTPKPMGEQKYALGEHQGRIPLTEEEQKKTPYHYMEYPELHDTYLEMVRRTVERYRDDERILVWNIMNEPGITIGERSIPILRELFDLVRELDPIQPLTADVWRGLDDNGNTRSREEALALELSDVISFHNYTDFPSVIAELSHHLKDGRPVFLTEWLHRINHNDIFDIYPTLYLNNVANYCWGFVVGRTQTHEPWPHMWWEWDQGRGREYDFTKWQHDLFRPNLRPYDPHETALIKKFNDMADKDYKG